MTKLAKTKSGSTALYVVVFASLLFTVITVGFVNLIISEVSMTTNDELSQSAYDAALAGIEDAKLAIVTCNSVDAPTECSYINTDIPSTPPDPGEPAYGGGCNTVFSILGRETPDNWGATVTEQDAGANGETNQAYTCVTIKDELPDYRSSLSFTDTDSVRLVPLKSSEINEVSHIRLSWYTNTDNNRLAFLNLNSDHTEAVFRPTSAGLSEPPTLSVSLIQTAETFTIESSETDYTVGATTDRGTLILVPSPDTGLTTISSSVSAHVIYGGVRVQGATSAGFIKANDKAQTNVPYIVKCDPDVAASLGREFICSVIIELPAPVGEDGTRNDDTSMLAISMLYGQPSTDFSVELCRDANCADIINFNGAQYAIDSTGRAADVYNRVEHRVEIYDTYFPFSAYALQLNGTRTNLDKVFWAANDECVYSDNDESSACSRTSGLFSNPGQRILNGDRRTTVTAPRLNE